MENDLINRVDAMKIVKRTNGDYAAAFSEIRKLKSVDAAPVVHGHLVDFYSGEYNDFANCSICGAENLAKAKFCCMCGAVMDGKDISK